MQVIQIIWETESEESCFSDIHTCLRNYFSLAMQSET